VAALRQIGHRIVVVTSGAIAAGLPLLQLGDRRPRDAVTLQAASAVGQSRLMGVYDAAFAELDLVGGQVLLAPLDFMVRQQYLHARSTLTRCSSWAWCRWSTRTTPSPTTRSASATTTGSPRWSPTSSADLLVLLTDQPGCSPPIPASTPRPR
jgi:glutamate 5-kinase